MNPDEHKFKHRELTSRVIGAFYDVYNELGHGFLESVYQASLEIAISSLDMKVLRKIEIPVSFRGHQVGIFEADMIVNDVLLLELRQFEP
jgi:GxxExxY protein